MAGRITSIQVQKKNQRRVNISLDGEFAFGLAFVDAARLSKGQYLSDDDIAALRAADDRTRAYDFALDFLSYRPRSRAEVTNRLRKKAFHESVIEDVLQRLAQAQLIDDAAFARYWIRNREQFKPRGVRALRYELRQKGIADELIDELLQNVDQIEGAYQAVASRVPKWRRLDRATFRRKLVGYLQRRGFYYDVISQVWDRIESELEASRFDGEEREDTEIWD